MRTKTKGARGKGKDASVDLNGIRTAATAGGDPAYLALIRRFALRPLRTDAELDAASELVDELTGRDDLSAAEIDYLDVLGDLVEKYEDEHVEMPHVSDAAMLRSLMDEKGVRQADVVRGTGISKTVLSLLKWPQPRSWDQSDQTVDHRLSSRRGRVKPFIAYPATTHESSPRST